MLTYYPPSQLDKHTLEKYGDASVQDSEASESVCEMASGIDKAESRDKHNTVVSEKVVAI